MSQFGNKMNSSGMGQNVGGGGMNPGGPGMGGVGSGTGRMGMDTGRMTPGMDGMMSGGQGGMGSGGRDGMGMGTGGGMGNMGNQMGTGGMGNQMGTGGQMGNQMGNQMGTGGTMGSGMQSGMGNQMGNQMGSGMSGTGQMGSGGMGMQNQMSNQMSNQMNRDMMNRDGMGTGMGGMNTGMGGNQMQGNQMSNQMGPGGMMGPGTGGMMGGRMGPGTSMATSMSGTLMGGGGMTTSASLMGMSGTMVTGGYLPQQHNVDSLGLPEPVHRMISNMKDRKNMELTWKISGDNMATIITLSWSPLISNTSTSPTRWNSTPMLYKGPPQRTNSFTKRSDSQIALFNPQNYSTRLSNGDLRMLRESGYESWNYQNPGDPTGQQQQQQRAITYASDDKYMLEMMEKENRGLKTTTSGASSQHGTVISNGGGGDAWKDKISKLQEKCAQIPKLVQFKLSQGAEGYGQNRAPGMWDANTRTNIPVNQGVQNRSMVFEDSSDLDWASMLDKPAGHRQQQQQQQQQHQQQQQYDSYQQDQSAYGRDSGYQGTGGGAGGGYRDAHSPYAHGGDQRSRGGVGPSSLPLPFEKVVYDYRSGVLRAKLKHIIVHHDPGGDVYDIVHPSMGEEYHGHLDIINRLEPIQDYSYHAGEDFAGRYQKQIQFMNKIAEEYLNDKNAGGKSRSIYHVIE